VPPHTFFNGSCSPCTPARAEPLCLAQRRRPVPHLRGRPTRPPPPPRGTARAVPAVSRPRRRRSWWGGAAMDTAEAGTVLRGRSLRGVQGIVRGLQLAASQLWRNHQTTPREVRTTPNLGNRPSTDHPPTHRPLPPVAPTPATAHRLPPPPPLPFPPTARALLRRFPSSGTSRPVVAS